MQTACLLSYSLLGFDGGKSGVLFVYEWKGKGKLQCSYYYYFRTLSEHRIRHGVQKHPVLLLGFCWDADRVPPPLVPSHLWVLFSMALLKPVAVEIPPHSSALKILGRQLEDMLEEKKKASVT